MRFVMFYHSLVSDWNHGNAHFLRGVVSELMDLGHEVQVLEPAQGWSRQSLLAEQGRAPLAAFRRAYPGLTSALYDPETIDLDSVLDAADVCLVHEWNDPDLIRRIGLHRRGHGHFRLLFHDTHHRLATDPKSIKAFDLGDYDGVLAFGDVIRRLYLDQGLTDRAWTWHEAADVRVFKPVQDRRRGGDVVWVGNWGDEERTEEIFRYLLEPVRELGLKGTVHGVRYPAEALASLASAGLRYKGWLPNFKVPEVFARHRVTTHIPRRPYAKALPGIPTIRVFEALACGIPLISAPWDDAEGLFTFGQDFLVAHTPTQMKRHLRDVLEDAALAQELARHGRAAILARHTCLHRVRELFGFLAELGLQPEAAVRSDSGFGDGPAAREAANG